MRHHPARIPALFLAAFLCLLFLPPSAASAAPGKPEKEAAEAKNITKRCRLSVYSGQGEKAFLTDGRYKTYWRSSLRGWLRVRTPEDRPAAGIYVSWAETMVDWAVQVPAEGGWADLILSDGEKYFNQYIPLPGLTDFRIECRSPRKSGQVMCVSEISVYTEGKLPEGVQVWRRMEGDADLMLLVAHPDDELLWFGGALPVYAGEEGKKVIVAYMANTAAARKSELLDGLWLCGVRDYPEMGIFRDSFAMTLLDMYDLWDRNAVLGRVVSLIRQYRPRVLLTHGLNGEYGHGAHKVCADAAVKAFRKAADPAYRVKGAEALEPWQVSKLYLHLHPENPLCMDWRRPLQAFGGETGLSVAQRAFDKHVSQRHTEYRVLDAGKYACTLFGLHSTVVGPDIEGDGFFENVP